MFRKIFSKSLRFGFIKRISDNPRLFAVRYVPTGGNYNKFTGLTPLVAFSIPSFFSKDEETPEDKLIETIKRSILCIQREEYSKAEQMLHLALRMAQDMKSDKGVTYIYDVMANLAMERGQMQKAEKLFVDVMRRLMGEGYPEDGIKMLHISSKIAHMAQIEGHVEKAKQGFIWTLKKVEDLLVMDKDDKEAKELLGLTKKWYGELLMDCEQFEEAKKYFESAYDTLLDFYGKANEEAIMILNNLSVACLNLNDTKRAKEYLEEALDMAKKFPQMVETGVLQANLGILYLKEGLTDKAREMCTTAWKVGKQRKDNDTIEQASYCLDEIKKVLK